MMGGNGTFICHKRQVIHKKLGVLAPTGMTALPEWGTWARSDRLRKAGTREHLDPLSVVVGTVLTRVG